MKHSPLRKAIIRHLLHGNPDQQWFERHPDRRFRIRPKRPDERGAGFSIIRKTTPYFRTSVDLDREYVMLADTDDELDKVYRIIRDGTRCLTFMVDGDVLGEEELEL